MRGLVEKRMVIGGAATGIGAALAERLAAEGANLFLGDVNESGAEALAEKLRARGSKINAAAFDLADRGSIAALVAAAVDFLGGIDGLAIPAADLSARGYRSDGHIMNGVNIVLWERTFQINLIGHACLMQEAIPHMVAAGGGAIVSVSSEAAFAGHGDKPAYSASKAGLHALIRHVARLSGKDNIRCNGVAPGLVLTETALDVIGDGWLDDRLAINALPRHGTAEDVASTLAFLLSDDSSWITGQIMAVNGGSVFRD
jgi:NAD(P)-dependent dehydrogenase (short-subunit alcohol dehydrogenase family)